MPGVGSSTIFLLLALATEIAGTLAGFGSSVFFVPIANFYFDFQSVLGITALFHLASNASKLGLFRGGIDRGLLLRLGVPSVLFAILGGLASAWLLTRWLEAILAVFLLGLSGWMLLRPRWRIAPTDTSAIVGGALSGGMAGLVGTGGAVRGMTLAAFDLRKEVFIATSAAIDLGIDLSRVAVYVRNGYIHAHDMKWIPLLAVVAFAGTWIGKRILLRIPQGWFRRTSLALVFAIGLVTLYQALRA
ncbi:MAG: sulfite exporter TauE/SafE family protein [Pseudomonadota bacterium]